MPRTARLVAGVAVAVLLATAVAAVRPGPVSPEVVLGFAPCADRRLAGPEEIAGYLQRLDRASDRVQLFAIGTTTAGRTQWLAAISSEANLQALPRHKTIARRLALARGLDDGQARALAEEGRVIVWIDFGLHSSELAHAQAAPLLAWRVATDESEEMRRIRDQVILVLVPDMNPDGTALWVDWYRRHVGTPFEHSSPPELYHPYGGHDNNRDWFMFNMRESRNVARQLYAEWFPRIVYNQHQEAPFPARIFIPPFDDPMNPHIPPLVMRGVASVGEAIGRRLAQEGKPGAISRIGFDTWWNGGMRTAPYFHNMVGILTETAHTSPAPATYDAARFPKAFSNGVPTLEPSTTYPSPWRGGPWRFGDSCDYMVSASMAVLDIAARQRADWLFDGYQMGRDAIGAGADEAYLVSPEQWDAGSAARMIDALRIGGLEIERAIEPFTAAGRAFPPGTFVIRGAQAFRAYATDLLNPQVYPDRRHYPGGPPARPYDVTGWTLPYQMGVEVHRTDERISVRTEPVEAVGPPYVALPGAARAAFALDPRANATFTLVNRLLTAGERVWRAADPLEAGGVAWPAGAFLVDARPGTHARLAEAARALGVTAVALDALPSVRTWPLKRPRIGLYRAWGGNADEGWTRFVLEEFEFVAEPVRDADLRQGDLAARWDVIVLPDATYEAMLKGLAPGTMPPDYLGGMTPTGIAHLYAFVTAGGTLVALDGAGELPLTAFGLPMGNVTAAQRETDFYVPGSLVRVALDPSHPVAFGLPRESVGVFANSLAFDVTRRRSRLEQRLADDSAALTPGVQVVGTYASRDVLASGYMLGERTIAGRPAVVVAAVGSGRVVLIGFRAQHRGQPHGTFKLLFNAVLLGGGMAGDPGPHGGASLR